MNLAPNGKPSNLTPEQYALVRTPAFKAWFGDWESSPETASKVVDENGEPLIVYHGYMVGGGAGKKFYEFKNLPAFFSKNRDFAEQYASTKSMDAGLDADIYSHACFLNIRKLFDSENKEIIELAREQLPEKIKVSHGTAWFLSGDMPKEELLEQMRGIITIQADDMTEDILAANVGDVIAEKVSYRQYENKILLYKDDDWAYITDARYFDEAVNYEVAQWINKDEDRTIKYKDKYIPSLVFNEKTYTYELNKDALFLEYLDEVEKRKKYYIDNILYLLDNAKNRLIIEVTNKAGNKKNFYVRKINLKTYKTTTKNNWTIYENETLQKFLIDNNFDGWFAYERGAKTYAVYKSTNIKLADGTNTTFDSNNADIRYNNGGNILPKNELIRKMYGWYSSFKDRYYKDLKSAHKDIERVVDFNNKQFGTIFGNDNPKDIINLFNFIETKKGIIVEPKIKQSVSNKKIEYITDSDLVNKEKQIWEYGHGIEIGRYFSKLQYIDTDDSRIYGTEKPKEEKIIKLMNKLKNGDELPPILLDYDFGILDGHHRYEASKRLGIKQIPIIIYEYPDIRYVDGGSIPDLLSSQEVENKLGRKLDWWNDDIVYLSGIEYKKVYLRPEYKKVIE